MSHKSKKQLLEAWKDELATPEGEVGLSEEVSEATAQLLENTQKSAGKYSNVRLDESSTTTGEVAGYDPVLFSMVRRTMPSLIHFDIVGVQPLKQSTGKIFAMKSWYGAPNGTEALGLDEPNKDYTGPMTTAAGEVLGTNKVTDASQTAADTPVTQLNPWADLTFTVESQDVSVSTRALKGSYTEELAQDMRDIHGLDAGVELSNMMVTEMRAEMNREMVFTVRSQAKPGLDNAGFQQVAVPGTYNLSADADGRWSVEKYKNLMVTLWREAQVIATETRRGVGNFIITTTDIAAALAEASNLDTTFKTQGLSFDGLGITYAGLLSGKFKLYVDPYLTAQEVLIGYKGPHKFDAGVIWAPYIPMYKWEARGEDDGQPRMGYKTRYGITTNPFVSGTAGENTYYRKFTVSNL